MRLVVYKFNFKCTRLFFDKFKIVLERFRNFLLHYGYMGGILTVVRACPETQLDYSNYSSSTKRTVEEVEKKWHNIQMKGKAELADARRSVKQTGGGPAGKPLTPLAEAVGSVIGTNNISISGIPGTVDTTYLMLDRPKISTETTASTMYVQEFYTPFLNSWIEN
ncbi:uncharacterized protein LOC130049433 [Ostrea edulis]|uniref:uncharacterized protein LOC130049433 n=1 Tax=Ostrea edulis TaxID=37623 RepID=UPI0024AF39A1|nr:uncharacterized protein LOC130049433 [Ostrea edulis]